ncbi:hypothetical protein [Yoonia sediminilitoris]|uniref:HNH endonuclease n=1 Tax=Yoonia sediminilitoris TaxID=1286148 RepID=A0A2T6K749_9RHOB|nr:hypothetical protein [Yoonia sediminilitoris]PUB10529.1 hypothetical protein C8N45_1188 [Yoonia sediminilitoris]RCW90091.1 hypothetical protein DFP92_11836 [Yoonia sediminilitoris]
MGQAKRKILSNKLFLERHKYCCLCGGSVYATTIEHAPPKVFFVNKEVPSATHRVPACERCNSGSSGSDQVAALSALIQSTIHQDIPETYMEKLVKGVQNNAPSAFAAIAEGSSTDVPIKVNGRVNMYARVEIDNSIYTDWLNPWAAKQAYALHYLHAEGKILPDTAKVMVRWFTNAQVIDEETPDDLLRSLRNYGELRQGKKTSELQYSYKWQLEGEVGCFVLMLHDASMLLLGIFQDSEKAKAFPHWNIFSTNARRGIHRVES